MARALDPVDVFVGARIALRRAAVGLSQTALAARLGISFQQVQKYERGANRVSASRLHMIAASLGASVADFFPPVSGRALDDQAAEWLTELRLLTATADGRTIGAAFPLIADREVRQAVARVVRALAQAA